MFASSKTWKRIGKSRASTVTLRVSLSVVRIKGGMNISSCVAVFSIMGCREGARFYPRDSRSLVDFQRISSLFCSTRLFQCFVEICDRTLRFFIHAVSLFVPHSPTHAVRQIRSAHCPSLRLDVLQSANFGSLVSLRGFFDPLRNFFLALWYLALHVSPSVTEALRFWCSDPVCPSLVPHGRSARDCSFMFRGFRKVQFQSSESARGCCAAVDFQYNFFAAL